MTPSGNRNLDLPACSSVPQPTAPHRVPKQFCISSFMRSLVTTQIVFWGTNRKWLRVCPVAKTNWLTSKSVYEVITIHVQKYQRSASTTGNTDVQQWATQTYNNGQHRRNKDLTVIWTVYNLAISYVIPDTYISAVRKSDIPRGTSGSAISVPLNRNLPACPCIKE